MNSIRTFRHVAIAEATTFLALLVAAVVKRTDGNELGVQVLGPIHGLLFLTYLYFTLSLRPQIGWSTQTTALLVVGAIVPFGGYAVDRWLARTAATA